MVEYTPLNNLDELPQEQASEVMEKPFVPEEASLVELEDHYENLDLASSKESVNAKDIAEELSKRIDRTRNADRDEKRFLNGVGETAKDWVEQLDPKSSDEAQEKYEKLPEEFREPILASYREEVLHTLTVATRYMGEKSASEETRAIVGNLIFAKASGEALPEENRASLEKLFENETEQVIGLIENIEHLGPKSFATYVDENFDGIDLDRASGIDALHERIDELNLKRAEVYEDLTDVLDGTLEEQQRPRWEKVVDLENDTWETLAKNVKPGDVLDATAAENHLVKSGLFGKEKLKQTKQTIWHSKLKAHLDVESPQGVLKREVSVPGVGVIIRAEEKLRGDAEGEAYAWNPWVDKELYKANYHSLEAITEGILQLEAAQMTDASGNPIEGPISYSEKGSVIDGEGYVIQGPYKYNITIIDGGRPKTLVVNSRTYNDWKASLARAQSAWEQKGFEYDPTKNTRKDIIQNASDKVDMLRQSNEVKKTGALLKEKIQSGALATRKDLEWGVSEQHNFDEGLRIYREFAERFNSSAEYKLIAETRVRAQGYEEDTEEWYRQVIQETHRVIVEMSYMETVLRNLATEIFDGTDDAEELHLKLANLNSTIEIRLALMLGQIASEEINRQEIYSRVSQLMNSFGASEGATGLDVDDKIDESRAWLQAANLDFTVM